MERERGEMTRENKIVRNEKDIYKRDEEEIY